MNPIEHLDEVHDANNNNQVMFDCGVAVLKRGKKVVKNVLEQQEFVASTETVNKNVEVGVAVSTGTVNNDIEVTQPQKQVVYLRKTTNITNGKFEYTPGHSKMGDVMKITAANKKTPTI